MRKISRILTVALMAFLFAGNAWAFSTVTWDLSLIGAKAIYQGSGGYASSISFDDSMVISNVGKPATVVQQFGADDTLGENDTFTESGIIGLIAKGTPDSPSPILFYDSATLTKDIFIYTYRR